MIGSDRLLGGKLFICLCVLSHFCTVSRARLYDDCVSEDGRRGLCVLKRYCREATQHELLHCKGDRENHCCPIATTQRSAPPSTERPRHDERLEPEEHLKRNDRPNKTTPPPGGRRSPTRPSSNERPSSKPTNGDHGGGYARQNPRTHHPSPNNGEEITPNRPRPQGTPTDHGKRDSGRPGSTRDPEFSRHTSPPPRRVQPSNGRVPVKYPNYPGETPITFTEQPAHRPRVPACGVKPYDLFIAGGEESQQHEWPWMTAIFRRHQNARHKTFLCGGSLITTKYVLTAAHCFVNNYVILPASSFVVRLGSHFLDSGEEYTVSNLVIHHNHSGSDYFNDIALVRLASEVYVTDKIAPICLPSPDMMDRDFVGSLATVAGWGDTSFRSAGSRVLQHVNIPIVTGEECSSAYSRVSGAAFLARGSEHIICAGLMEGGKDACLGDSGGPLMIKMKDGRWVIVGIVSLGYKCAEPGFPGVYTRVTHYMSWIYTNMKKH